VPTLAVSFDEFSLFDSGWSSADLWLMTAAITRKRTGMHMRHTVNNKCRVLALPIKSNSMQLAPRSSAVDKLAGAMSTQMMPTGMINGK
jgi:hypothetical protein